MSSNIGQATSVPIIKINTAELNCISSQGTKKKGISLIVFINKYFYFFCSLFFFTPRL